jgi:hypothetical protein
MKTMLYAAVALTMALPAHAQTTPAQERARAVLPPDVFTRVEAIAADAVRDGLPPEPLWDKALEGAAKRVPPARIAPAVSEYAARLSAAQGALGVGLAADALVAAADALRRGVPATALGQLGEARPRAMALVVLADLVETGVPVDRALDVVREAIARRTADEEMMAINARVRAAMRQGETAAAAAERVRRTIREGRPTAAPTRDRAGPPAPPGSQPRDPTMTPTMRPRGG